MVRRRGVPIHIYLDKRIKERLREIANRQGRTIADLIREGIVYIIDKYGKEIGDGKEDDN